MLALIFNQPSGVVVTTTHSTDAILRKTVNVSYSADALLRKTVSPNHITNAMLAKTHTLIYSTDSILQVEVGGGIFNISEADAVFDAWF